jgi:hypothetical protein
MIFKPRHIKTSSIEKYIKDKVIFLFMSENIKILEKDKNIFDMVQAEVTLKTGKKITQQELFSHLIEFVMSRKDNFFGRLSKLPLSEKEKKKIRNIPCDMGVNTNEEEIDMVVYGAKR